MSNSCSLFGTFVCFLSLLALSCIIEDSPPKISIYPYPINLYLEEGHSEVSLARPFFDSSKDFGITISNDGLEKLTIDTIIYNGLWYSLECDYNPHALKQAPLSEYYHDEYRCLCTLKDTTFTAGQILLDTIQIHSNAVNSPIAYIPVRCSVYAQDMLEHIVTLKHRPSYAAFSNDSKILAIADTSLGYPSTTPNNITFYSAETWTKVAEYDPEIKVTFMHFSMDDQDLALIGDFRAIVKDVNSWETKLNLFPEDKVCDYSQDGKYFITSYKLKLFNTSDYSLVKSFEGYNALYREIFTSDSKYYFGYEKHMSFKMFSTETLDEVMSFSKLNWNKSIIFHPFNHLIAVKSASTIDFIDYQLETTVNSINNYPAIIHSVDYYPTGRYLVCSTGQYIFTLWDMESYQPVSFTAQMGYSGTEQAIFSPDGQYLVTLTNNGIVIIFRMVNLDIDKE